MEFREELLDIDPVFHSGIYFRLYYLRMKSEWNMNQLSHWEIICQLEYDEYVLSDSSNYGINHTSKNGMFNCIPQFKVPCQELEVNRAN